MKHWSSKKKKKCNKEKIKKRNQEVFMEKQSQTFTAYRRGTKESVEASTKTGNIIALVVHKNQKRQREE